jgi:hypothetical protein
MGQMALSREDLDMVPALRAHLVAAEVADILEVGMGIYTTPVVVVEALLMAVLLSDEKQMDIGCLTLNTVL